MIKTVIFDLDGTLYDYDSRHERGMEALIGYGEKQLGTDRDAFCRTYDAANRMMAQRIGTVCAAIHNRMIRFEYMMELLEKPLFPHAMALYHTYWDTFLEGMVPEEGIAAWMKQLREQDIRIGIGTNMTTYIQYKKLERLGLTAYIDWIVTSEEVNCEKPEYRFFELCIEKSGVRPEECLFVGDTKKSDILGALRAGMHALYYEPEKRIPQRDPISRAVNVCAGQNADTEEKVKTEPEERWEHMEEGRYLAITSYHRCRAERFLEAFETF